MARKEWEVIEDGNTYNWKLKEKKENEQIIEELERDAYHADSGMVVSVLAFVVFIYSAISAGLFAGIVRTVALKANPSVNMEWLGGELQSLIVIAIIWLLVGQMLVLTVYSKCARVIASR